MKRVSLVRSTGSYLPERVMTNHDIAGQVDTSHEWIVQRTGIRERRIAGASEPTSYMAAEAARRALKSAGLNPGDIDGIIVATTTPDHTFPAVAVQVQAALGCPPCPAFDVQAVCSGFVYALSVADSMLKIGLAGRFLVIGADRMSALIDWTDRSTCILFGDGAGAVVLEAREAEAPGTDRPRGILASRLFADGRQKDLLYTDGGPSTTGTAGFLKMQGREVFRHAVMHMSEIVSDTLAAAGASAAELDWLLPHQANLRIIESTAQKLGLDMGKVIVTVGRHGNTSAASIPLAFDEAVRDGRIREGHLVLLEALGGGLTWGALALRM